MADYIGRVRNPYPPHETWAEFELGSGAGMGYQTGEMRTASFRLSRASPAIAAITTRTSRRVGPMVTIERDDGLWPWVGYLTRYTADPASPYYAYVAHDVGILLKSAITPASGVAEGGAARVVRQTVGEMQQRFVVPFALAGVGDGGPYVRWEYKADDGLRFLREVAEAADSEWWVEHEITEQRVLMTLWFRQRRGADLRDSVVWEEGKELARVEYVQDADGFVGEITAVGGSGPFADRPIFVLPPRTGAGVGDFGPTPLAASPVLSGAAVLTRLNTTNEEALRNLAVRYADIPETIGEQVSVTLSESRTLAGARVDMGSFGLGDLVTIRLATADLGLPRDVVARVLAVQLDPDGGEHDVELQVRR